MVKDALKAGGTYGLVGESTQNHYEGPVTAPGLENFQFLASFYGVDTVEELISAQEHQITRLQERIPQDQQCVLTTPREG